MSGLRVLSLVLGVAGLGLAVLGMVISRRRGERPAGPRWLVGGLLVACAVLIAVAFVAGD